MARRIHNKTVTVDDRVICEGSFNWLSSARRVDSPFHRYRCAGSGHRFPFLLDPEPGGPLLIDRTRVLNLTAPPGSSGGAVSRHGISGERGYAPV